MHQFPGLMWLSVLVLLAVYLYGLYIFSSGFFIYKTPILDFATFADFPIHKDQQILPKQQYDRFVMMVVDGLRQDFVFAETSQFKFLRE